MHQQVVQLQPRIRVQEAEQWSTGLCECYKDMGDCEYRQGDPNTLMLGEESKNPAVSWNLFVQAALHCAASQCSPVR